MSPNRLAPKQAQDTSTRAPTSRLSSVYVMRTGRAFDSPREIDHLDGLVLSCATQELPLDALLGRVPCSKRAGLDRVRKLAERGLLTVARVPQSAPARHDVEASAAAVCAEPTPHRLFRKPQPE
jgi:hypothetical protein